jgi:hypothetical protein
VDADPWGPVPYVATRYVPGLTLHDHVRDEGSITGADLLWLADCLAEALAAVHAVGVLHRDIKPSNVILEGRTPILIDFGLARVADDARVTQTGFLLGTPGYLAPEILFGEDACEVSDVHSWAATVAFAAQGRSPFGRGPSIAVMDRVRRGEHDIGEVADPIRELLEEALAPDPEDRPDLEEVRDWLADLGAPRARDERDTRDAVEAAPVPLTAPYVRAALVEPDETPAVVARELPPTRRHLDEAQTWRVPEERDAPDDEWPDDQEWPEDEEWSDDAESRDGWSPWTEVAPEPPPSPAFRLRRGVLLLAAGGVVSAATAAAPWLTLLTMSLLVWLLRGGSLASTALDRRRGRRGVRWFDSLVAGLSTPWHLVAALPGWVLLVTWSLGMAAAAALLGYALSLGSTTTLALVGATFVCGLWWGPGGSRFRGPVDRVASVGAARGVPWLLLALVVTACATGLLAYAQQVGTHWSPASDAPFANIQTPSWL